MVDTAQKAQEAKPMLGRELIEIAKQLDFSPPIYWSDSDS
jgi:hypothetical protein